MMRRHLCKLLILASTAVLLSGCGFQLKGNRSVGGESLAGIQVRLVADSPRGELATALRQALKLAGAELIDQSESDVVLRLGQEEFTRRNLALTAQARAAEVELTLNTVFSIRRGNRQLVDETPAAVIRLMLDDPGNVVGKNEEMRLLRQEMRRDVANQIVRRAGHSLTN